MSLRPMETASAVLAINAWHARRPSRVERVLVFTARI
jgi:hypothetical protein